jgi:hypothetical protein
MDPLRHPDLEQLGRTLRHQLDDTLEAEQLAALASARRRRTLRDRLIEAEDRVEQVVLFSLDGHAYRGTVEAVGVDHVVILDGDAERYVATGHIAALEVR